MNFKSSRLILFASATVLLFAFQNCGQPMPQEGDQSLGSVNAEDGSYTEAFPFDTKIDQVAMMSCSQNNPASQGYFTIRAGAYQDQGIKLSEEFNSKYLMKSTDQLASLIYNNPLTNEIAPRIALVEEQSSQPIFNNYLKNKDKMSLIGGPLTMFPIFKPIRDLKNNERLRYLKQYEGTTKRNVQGDILYSGVENNALMNSIKGKDGMKLALTYGPYSKPEQVLASNGYQSQNINETFSTVFDITLGTHQVGNSSNAVIKELKEGSTAWSCQDDYKFQIYRFEDTMNSPCSPRPDLTVKDINHVVRTSYSIPNNVQQQFYDTVVTEDHIRLQKALRRVLDPKNEHWFIDVINKCIVPKKASNKDACYEQSPVSATSNEMAYNIAYGVANCGITMTGQDGKVSTDFRRCPHYVSLCNRFPLKDISLEE